MTTETDWIRFRETRLPNKLHKLLTVAVRDLRKVEKDSRYVVKMSRYHYSTFGLHQPDTCYVCLAGAVIAKTIHVPPTVSCDPHFLGDRIADKLRALNELRLGELVSAVATLYGKDSAEYAQARVERRMSDFFPADYAEDQAAFYEDMKEIIEYLKHKDL